MLTATLDLEDIRSYRAEISSRNLVVSDYKHTHRMLIKDGDIFFNNSFIEMSFPYPVIHLSQHEMQWSLLYLWS